MSLRRQKEVQMQRMWVGVLQHLARRHLEGHGEGSTGRGPRKMMCSEGLHRAEKLWQLSIEQERLCTWRFVSEFCK